MELAAGVEEAYCLSLRLLYVAAAHRFLSRIAYVMRTREEELNVSYSIEAWWDAVD